MTRVLVVDDDPDMAALLGQMAAMAGYEPTVVKNGEAALEAARDTPPDVVLLDIMMSGLDGWAVYDRLRAVTVAPVVFVTAWHTAENAARARDLGEGFMTKPLSPEDLTAHVEGALKRGAGP